MFILMLVKLYREFRSTRTAFTKIAKIRELRGVVGEQVTTQAAGYGFEIGQGQPLLSVLQASPANPFLNPNWRDQVIENE